MTLEIRTLAIPDVKLITPKRFADTRGYFVESWNRKTMRSQGLDFDFCQDNQSLSIHPGTIRGLHFQQPPHEQAKLVGVLRGRIFDVALDLRKSSPHFGRHVAVELEAASGTQILIPKGFAHGFCTLEPDTQVFYKVDAPYAPESDTGIYWADETLRIAWPVVPGLSHISPKDEALPRWHAITSPFE